MFFFRNLRESPHFHLIIYFSFVKLIHIFQNYEGFMDVQVQELIDKIKKDGVVSAETTAADIIAKAEKQAAGIVADAEVKAAGILKTAKTETERMEKSSVDAIKEAGRDLLLNFRDGITKELTVLLNSETTTAYSADILKTLIPETVKSWVEKPEAEDITVLLNPKDFESLESGFKSALKVQIAKGLEIKPDATVAAGFRIGEKDGSAYYDFSAESVAALFASYLNPRVASIMKQAATAM
jgi:V/A-type H+-transporting ATPase subunit E